MAEPGRGPSETERRAFLDELALQASDKNDAARGGWEDVVNVLAAARTPLMYGASKLDDLLGTPQTLAKVNKGLQGQGATSDLLESVVPRSVKDSRAGALAEVLAKTPAKRRMDVIPKDLVDYKRYNPNLSDEQLAYLAPNYAKTKLENKAELGVPANIKEVFINGQPRASLEQRTRDPKPLASRIAMTEELAKLDPQKETNSFYNNWLEQMYRDHHAASKGVHLDVSPRQTLADVTDKVSPYKPPKGASVNPETGIPVDPKMIRDLSRYLSATNPDKEFVHGNRVSGVRAGRSEEVAQKLPKLKSPEEAQQKRSAASQWLSELINSRATGDPLASPASYLKTAPPSLTK